MDPRKLFADERFAVCAYCGGEPSGVDHVPSKVLLDTPMPNDLPVVQACTDCNNGFSLDEEYLACFLECVICDSANPDSIRRENIKRILTEKPSLVARIAGSRRIEDPGIANWIPELDRVRNVVLKLARGHAAFHLSEPQLEEPEIFSFVPLADLTSEQLQLFESVPKERLYPEIGSRAFLRINIVGLHGEFDHGWEVIQKERYRYMISHSDRIMIRIVLSEYLACEVIW